MGEQNLNTILTLALNESGQFHAMAALPLGKNCPVPVVWEVW